MLLLQGFQNSTLSTIFQYMLYTLSLGNSYYDKDNIAQFRNGISTLPTLELTLKNNIHLILLIPMIKKLYLGTLILFLGGG